MVKWYFIFVSVDGFILFLIKLETELRKKNVIDLNVRLRNADHSVIFNLLEEKEGVQEEVADEGEVINSDWHFNGNQIKWV